MFHAVSSTGEGSRDSTRSVASGAHNSRESTLSAPNFSGCPHRMQAPRRSGEEALGLEIRDVDQEPGVRFVVFRAVERPEVAPDFVVADFVALPGFDAAPFEGDRFAVVVLFADAVLFEVAAFDAAGLDAVLLDDALADRRAFFGELPFGSAFSIALPALVAALPTALPAVVAAPPTAFPALVAAPPTALPGPEAATVSAALLTVPAALPTVLPTFFPMVFRILAVSGIFVLLVPPGRRAVDRSMAMQPPCRYGTNDA